MPYHYTDPSRESQEHALPDVEIFERCEYIYLWRLGVDVPDPDTDWDQGEGFYYAYGFPGCLWDSDPVGPFDSEEEALMVAREELS